jgi:glycosyltransferase involved in cell wall biosynthesis
MKILFVGKRHYTRKDLLNDRFGRLYHLPRALAENGHHVDVIALDYRTRELRTHREENLLIRSEPSRSSGLFVSRKRLTLSDETPPNLIIGTGHLHIAGHGLRLARNFGVPFVFEAYDYYPAFLPKVLSPVSRRWFRYLCRRAEGCVAASHELGKLMGRSNPKALVVENGFDPSVFKKVSRASSMRELRLDDDRRYVAFIGSATEDLGFCDFLEAIKMVRAKFPDALGIHAGHLDTELRLTPDCISLGPIGQGAVSTLLSCSDCGVVPYRETPQVRYSNSCKLVEYLAIGLPIVATTTGDNVRILGKDHPGLVPASDPVALAAAIGRQLKHPHTAPYPVEWTWDQLGSKLEWFLEEILRMGKSMSSPAQL